MHIYNIYILHIFMNYIKPKLTLLLFIRDDAVDLVGLGDVQLRPVRHLLEVRALVQGAAEPGFPGRRLSLVSLFELAFEHGPGLKNTRKADQ